MHVVQPCIIIHEPGVETSIGFCDHEILGAPAWCKLRPKNCWSLKEGRFSLHVLSQSLLFYVIYATVLTWAK